MSLLPFRLLCAAACLAIAGCADPAEPDDAANQSPLTGSPLTGSPLTGSPANQPPANGGAPRSATEDETPDAPASYVACRATLTQFDAAHRWFDNSGAGHDDGTAPLAQFTVTDPARYAGRRLAILFKYAPRDAAHAPPGEADIGSQFAFEVPEALLEGGHHLVDNTVVRRFRTVDPPVSTLRPAALPPGE